MTKHELSNSNGEDFSNTMFNPNLQLSSAEMDLADKLSIFRMTLENDRAADSVSHCFTFRHNNLAEIFLPLQVKQLESRHGTLSNLNIETHYLNGCDGISYELRIEFIDRSNQSTWLTVSRPYNDSEQSPHHDVVSLVGGNQFVEGKQSYVVDAFTLQEFNRCLGSLLFCSPHINQSAFDFYDWYHDNYFVMTDNFSQVADKFWSHHEYLLPDHQGGLAGLLSYFKNDDDISEIRLSRIVQQEAAVYGNHTQYFEKTLEMSLPLSHSSQIELFEHSIRDKEAHTQVCIPTESDYSAALDFVNEQLNGIKNMPVEKFDDETIQPLDD